MESVQAYNEGGWDYTTELISFVNGGMSGNGFIDGVSGIVNRGCHNPVSLRSVHEVLPQCTVPPRLMIFVYCLCINSPAAPGL